MDAHDTPASDDSHGTSTAYPAPMPSGNPSAPKATAITGQLRPMGIGEIIDAAFRLYRQNLLLFMAITAVALVPLGIVNAILAQISALGRREKEFQDLSRLANQHNGVLSSNDAATVTNDLLVIGAFGLLSFPISYILVQPLMEAAATRAISDRYLGREATFGSSYRGAVRRVRSLLAYIGIQVLGVVSIFAVVTAVSLLIGVLSGSSAAGVAFLVVGIIAGSVTIFIVAIRWAVAAPIIIVEGTSGWRGALRSWHLTKQCFWRVLGILLVVGLLVGILAGVLGAIMSALTSGADPSTRVTITQITNSLASIFFVPLSLIVVVLLYYDLRIRKEAFDIEVLASSL